MRPALCLLPPLPSLPRGPAEQLRLPPAGAFLALAFVPPRRARELCRRLPLRARELPAVLPPPVALPPRRRRAPAPPGSRPGQGRSRSLGTHPLTPAEIAEGKRLRRLTPVLDQRPRTRADCANIPRPCVYVGCNRNLYLDITAGGAVRLNFPDREPHEMPARWSCVSDIAERGGASLPEIGRALNITMQRSCQIEQEGLRKLRDTPQGADFLEALRAVIQAKAERE